MSCYELQVWIIMVQKLKKAHLCIKGKLPNRMWLICPVETVVPPGVFSQLKDSQTTERKNTVQFSLHQLVHNVGMGWHLDCPEGIFHAHTIHPFTSLSLRQMILYNGDGTLFATERNRDRSFFSPTVSKEQITAVESHFGPQFLLAKMSLGKKNLQL